MHAHRNLAVLDAATLAADEINQVIARTPQLLHADQLARASQSIGANIAEGFGRGPGPDRARFLRIARGSAEECIQHLRTNFAAGVLADRPYWSHHNRLVTITRMLSALIARTSRLQTSHTG